MLKRGHLRWWIIGLVTLGTILNYLARSTLSVTAPTLKTEFAMNTEQYSWVILAFQATYTIMQSVAGGILDALGTRLGFFLFAIGWALSNMAHAFATGWPSLAFFRGLLGATEAAAASGRISGAGGHFIICRKSSSPPWLATGLRFRDLWNSSLDWERSFAH